VGARFRIRLVDAHEDEEVADEFRDLHRLCFPELPPHNPEDLAGWWWFVINGRRQIVGFAEMRPSVRELGAVYLARSGVLPEARGHGLQKRLIRVRLRLARRLGYGVAYSDTITNPHSANNLAACGFTLFEPTKGWGAKGALYWRKELLT
jgi:GNAT superfamily N-acetyltransferase